MRQPNVFLAAIFIAGCSGSDPGADQSSLSADQVDNSDDGGPPTFHAPTPHSTDGGSPHTQDASTTPPPDADLPIDPGVPVANPTDAFSGATAYASGLPPVRANDKHASSITGQPCLSCHDGVTCMKFDFAGTVWQWPELAKPASDVEVRIIDSNSYAHSVHSDADGNFWHRSNSDLVLPAYSGVRTAGFQAVGTLNGVSCNDCHNTGKSFPGRLFVK